MKLKRFIIISTKRICKLIGLRRSITAGAGLLTGISADENTNRGEMLD